MLNNTIRAFVQALHDALQTEAKAQNLNLYEIDVSLEGESIISSPVLYARLEQCDREMSVGNLVNLDDGPFAGLMPDYKTYWRGNFDGEAGVNYNIDIYYGDHLAIYQCVTSGEYTDDNYDAWADISVYVRDNRDDVLQLVNQRISDDFVEESHSLVDLAKRFPLQAFKGLRSIAESIDECRLQPEGIDLMRQASMDAFKIIRVLTRKAIDLEWALFCSDFPTRLVETFDNVTFDVESTYNDEGGYFDAVHSITIHCEFDGVDFELEVNNPTVDALPVGLKEIGEEVLNDLCDHEGLREFLELYYDEYNSTEFMVPKSEPLEMAA